MPQPNNTNNNIANTLLWGTANPEGIENYNGIYLSRDDVSDMVTQIDSASTRGAPLPVHVEHKGVPIGHVVSAWENSGRLECVLALDSKVLEGSISAEMVRSGLCKDLSLGYTVALENSAKGIVARKKNLKEISVVVKGMRRKCHIHGISSSSSSSKSSSSSNSSHKR